MRFWKRQNESVLLSTILLNPHQPPNSPTSSLSTAPSSRDHLTLYAQPSFGVHTDQCFSKVSYHRSWTRDSCWIGSQDQEEEEKKEKDECHRSSCCTTVSNSGTTENLDLGIVLWFWFLSLSYLFVLINVCYHVLVFVFDAIFVNILSPTMRPREHWNS